jgi:hypothetical protein
LALPGDALRSGNAAYSRALAFLFQVLKDLLNHQWILDAGEEESAAPAVRKAAPTRL